MIVARDLRNAIAVLRCIDLHELGRAGVHLTGLEWASFSNDPYRFFLRAPTAQCEAITRIVNERLKENV